jgi:G3E family GTPase
MLRKASSSKKWTSNVCVVSGFLGAGKTTMVQAILRTAPDTMKIAVLVNDLAEVNIDASEIKKSTKDLVELTNGCICCNLRGELLDELVKIHKQKKFTHIVVECTGVAEPMQVAETFFLPALKGKTQTLQGLGLNLTMCVTLVDATAFESHLAGKVAQLLTEQIEFANTLVVNKCDLAPAKDVSRVCEVLRRMNPRAKVVQSKFGDVPDITKLLTEVVFSLDEAQQQGEWMQSLELYLDHSESHSYDIVSFVYRRQRPFHPQRLHNFLFDPEKRNAFGQVLRMKGYLWIGAKGPRYDLMGYCNLAGNAVTVQPAGKWLSALTDEELPPDISTEEISEIRKDRLKDGLTYDRRQELVVIGHGKQLKEMESHLDTLLMSPEEVYAPYETLVDPFEDWAAGLACPRENGGGHAHTHGDGQMCYGEHGEDDNNPSKRRKK